MGGIFYSDRISYENNGNDYNGNNEDDDNDEDEVVNEDELSDNESEIRNNVRPKRNAAILAKKNIKKWCQ